MTGLQTVSERLLTASSVESVWQITLEEVVQRLGADGGAWVWNLPSPKTAPLYNTSLLGSTEWRNVVVRLDKPFEAQCAVVGSPSVSYNTVVVPVSVGEWDGWLVLARDGGQFTSEDLECAYSASVVARMAVSGLLRYAYVDEARECQIRELEMFQHMVRAMSESLDPETALNVVLDTLSSLIPYDAGEITLLDAEQGVLISQAYRANAHTLQDIHLEGTLYQLDEGLSGWLARNRQPLLIDDVLKFNVAEPKSETLKLWSRSFLGIPLIARGELVGTLEIASTKVGQFTDHHKALVELFGGQAAIAIENARLYRAMQKRVDTLERLRAAVRAIGRARDLESVIYEVVAQVAGIVDASVVGILLYDSDRRALVAQLPFLGVPDEWVRNYVITVADQSALVEMWREQFYLLTDDAQSDAQVEALGLLPLAIATDVRQVLSVSLETGGELVGLIQVAKPKGRRRFTEEDARLLAMLASQISGTVYNSQLVSRMARRAGHMQSLVSVASTIGASLNLDTVLAEVVEMVSGVFDCRRTAIFVMDPVTGLLNLAAGSGVSERYRELSQGIPLTKGGRAHAIAANEVVISSDITREPEISQIAPFSREEGFRAFVDYPLCRGEKPVGLLSLQYTEPHRFADDELNVLHILAEQISIAIENARLYTQTDAELRHRLEAMEALQRVTRDITSTLDLDHILNGVLRDAIRFSRADAGLIMLFNAGGDAVLRAFDGYDAVTLEAIRRDIAGREPDARLTRFQTLQETVYIPDVQQAAHLSAFPSGARTLLVAPVFHEQRVVAVIMVQNHAVRPFSQTALAFIDGLAAQTSIAIGNTQRYDEQLARSDLMHKRAEQMSLLLEVTRTMRSDRPLEDTLLDVAYAVQEGTGFNVVLISVLEGDAVRRVAGAGIPLARLEQMKQVRHPWPRIQALFQEQFRIGRCYYIPAEYYDSVLAGIDVFIPHAEGMDRQPGVWHQKDTFVIPLHGSRGEIVGIMTVDDPIDGLVPTAITAEVIEIFAAQVALAIENNRLVEDLRRQVNTLRLFNELNRSITTKLDLPLVLNTVVRSVTDWLDYDYATIFLQGATGRYFAPLATSGYSLDGETDAVYGRNIGLVETVAQMGMPLVVEDTATDPRFNAGPVDIGSSMMVPLMAEGRSVGVLAAGRKAKGDFTPTDVATLTALADQVSVAVENARLFDEVKRFSEELELRVAERTRELAEALEGLRLQRDRSEVLYHIAAELVASLDMDRVLSQTLSLLQKAVKASRSAVILLDNHSGRLFYRAAIGHTDHIPPGGRLAPFGRDEGVVGWALTQKAALIIPNALEDDRCVAVVNEAARSVLVAPILGGTGEALGVILLQAAVEDVFGEPELRLVEAAAVQLGNALNNAELYRLIREQAERLGTMLRTQQIEAAKNQAILEGIADGVMVGDANGRVILFNAAAARILSISREQALGRFQDEILGLYGSAARDWLAQIERWRQAPGAHDVEEFLAHRLEVGRRFVSVHLSPVISPTREFLGVVSVFRDITSEVEADRAKSDFVSTVSHELRTPMTSIVGYVDLILMGATGPLSDLQNDFLQKVKLNSSRLTGLVNDLLDISRIETGRIELQFSPVEIEEVVTQVMDLIHPKVEEKEQLLYAEVPPALPKVYGDADRLAQIMTNIVGNAHKYTPVGGKIGIYVYVRDAVMHVAVADTGIGIASENQKKIFERFYRVEDDPAVYEVSGTGLGLAISLSLIQMHGGEIALESALGKGSVFTFSLPLAEGEPAEDVGVLPPRIITDPKATILVVEDDRESSDLLKIMLQKGDVEFLTATSGEDALRLARERLPDLISLDIRLPDLDGFEVLQLLKRDDTTADIPVVIITVTQDRNYGLSLGAAEYLLKPLNEKRLREVIVRLLHQQGTVVVADKDRESRDALRSALQLQGLKVHTARTGARALRLVQDVSPAVVVIGALLEDMDYGQLLEAFEQTPEIADIPVLVIAGASTQAGECVSTLETLGPVQFLTQPFSVDELAARIAYLMSENGTKRSNEHG